MAPQDFQGPTSVCGPPPRVTIVTGLLAMVMLLYALITYDSVKLHEELPPWIAFRPSVPIPPPPDGYSLRQIVVMHRHGDRATLLKDAKVGSVTAPRSFWASTLPSTAEQARWRTAHPIIGKQVAADEEDAPFGRL